MALSAIERLRLGKDLRAARADLSQAASPIAKLKVVKVIREIRQKLGLGAASDRTGADAVTPPNPPATEPTTVSPHLVALRAVTSGGMDAQGLNALYGTILEAVNGLNDAGELAGEAVDVANAAITHWAELEIKTYG